MANVIFRYSVTPSYGCCGDSDGGFALTLTDGGDVEYMEYKFCKITESCRHFDLSPNAAAEIGSIISENNARLDDIPHKLKSAAYERRGILCSLNRRGGWHEHCWVSFWQFWRLTPHNCRDTPDILQSLHA